MENASKALLMSAGILIGIILLSLVVYLFGTFQDAADNLNDRSQALKMQSFNSPFTSMEGRQDVSPHEILSLVNTANEFNNPYIEDEKIQINDSQYIHVYVTLKSQNQYKNIDLTYVDKNDIKTMSNSDYKKDREDFIRRFLDGSYVYKIYNEELAKYGQFEFEYQEQESIYSPKKRKFYNCYRCDKIEKHPETGLVCKIYFTFQENYNEP